MLNVGPGYTNAVAVAIVMTGLGVGAGPDNATAQEPPTFTLAGQVVDAINQAPVIAAVIKVPALTRYTFSDVNGRFRLPDFPEGTWDIVVEQLGYHSVDASITVSEGNGLLLRLRPDPVALEGLRVRTRSERLLDHRRFRIPYRVTTISTPTIANAINPDPTAIFRQNSHSFIKPCSSDTDEALMPGCVVIKGDPVPINVFLNETPVPGGMVALSMLPQEDLHSMDWIPEMAQLRVYTKWFVDRLDNTEISLSPLVW